MILDSTFYSNISRTVVSGGNPLVYPTDVILLCDTNTGAIILDLCEIPANAWNTVYKLYVVDSGSNASVNNITINAPLGYTINGLASLTINSDGATALIRIANNNAYLASISISGGSALETDSQGILISANTTKIDFVGIKALLTAPNSVKVTNSFIAGTSLQITTLANTNALIANQWYNITDANYGYFTHNFNVFIPAITNSALATFGIGEFYNADYQNVGDYSGIIGFGSQLGIWTPTLAPAINDVCICDNLHYKNLTGANGLNPPPLDAFNWQVLSYSNTNGYLVVYDQINFDIKLSEVTFRKDEFNNEVELFKDSFTSKTSFDCFPFGNIIFNGNKVINQSLWYACNTLAVEVNDNTIQTGALVRFSTPFIADKFSKNVFIGCQRPMDFFTGDISFVVRRNYFFMCGSLNGTFTSVLMEDNVCTNTDFSLNLKNSYFFLDNQIDGSSILLNGDAGQLQRNIFKNAFISLPDEKSQVAWNTVEDGNLTIAFTNLGSVTRNVIIEQSTLYLNNVAFNVKVEQNYLFNRSFVNVADVNTDFGIQIPKAYGNTFKHCLLNIDNFAGFFANNSLENVQLTVSTFNGSFLDNNLSEGTIEISNMNSRNINSIFAKGFSLGSAGFGMYESYSGGTKINGVNTIQGTLDLTNASIYDLITQTLTIPADLAGWIGFITLQNANGLNINIIVNLINSSYRLYNDNGTTTFTTAPVAIAGVNELISTLVAPAIISINYLVNANDWIEIEKTNFNVAITQIQTFL